MFLGYFCTGLDRSIGVQEVEDPRKVVRLSALRTGRVYPQQRSLVSQGQDAAGRIKSVKNLSDAIGIFFCILMFSVFHP